MDDVELIWSDASSEVHRFVVGPFENNVYVVRCRRSGDAVLIDAADEHDHLLEVARQLGVRSVLETHGHHDHIQAVPAFREAGLEVSIAPQDAAMLPSYDLTLDDDAVIKVGHLELATIATPGHTPGSQCLLVDGMLLSGDTLFLDGCGRTDLPGSDPEEMYRTLTSRLADVSDDTILYPGHLYSPDPCAPMERVRRTNRALVPASREQWLAMFA